MHRFFVTAIGVVLTGIGAATPAKTPAPPPATSGYVLTQAGELANKGPIDDFWKEPSGEGKFAGVGGVPIAYRYHRREGGPAIVIASGRTEHFGKYAEVAYDLWRNGYSVYIHDHRGQGASGRLLGDDPDNRQKGHVESFEHYVDDLHTFVETKVKPGGHAALFLVGHSMGGGIATLYLLKHPSVFQRAVLASPMHRPDTAPLRTVTCPFTTGTRWLCPGCWVLFGLAGKGYEPPDERGNIYTSEPARLKRWFVGGIGEEQRIGKATRNWLAEACDASERMLEQAPKLRVPVMVLQSEDDEAVVPAAQDEFCRALATGGGRCHPHGEPVAYPSTVQALEGSVRRKVGHELFIERDAVRNDAMTRILDFFKPKP